MKKLLGILFIILLASASCSNKTFELQSATSKRFGGGTILSGTGTIYTFELKTFKNWKKLSIDSIIIGNRCFTDISLYIKGSPPSTEAYFEKGDILVLTVTHIKQPLITNDYPPKIIDGEFNENGIPVSRNLNGAAALIIVSIKNKFYEIPVSEFTVLKPEMRP